MYDYSPGRPRKPHVHRWYWWGSGSYCRGCGEVREEPPPPRPCKRGHDISLRVVHSTGHGAYTWRCIECNRMRKGQGMYNKSNVRPEDMVCRHGHKKSKWWYQRTKGEGKCAACEKLKYYFSNIDRRRSSTFARFLQELGGND